MRKVYVYLEPVDMDAWEAKNYHIIKAEENLRTGELTFSDRGKCLDGQYKVKWNANILGWQRIPDDDDVMRIFLAARQNRGDEICANCVRHFYADNDGA